MTDSIETSDREAEEPRMLRLPVVEMAAEPAPPPVAAGYEPHPVGTGERIRFLERDANRWKTLASMYRAKVGIGGLLKFIDEQVPLTSATKETK